MNEINADEIVTDLRDRAIDHRTFRRDRFVQALHRQGLTLRAIEKLIQDERDSYTVHWLERLDRACREVEN